LLLKKKRDQMAQVLAPGGVCGLGGLAKRHPFNCGELV